jgi:hypothetical protein
VTEDPATGPTGDGWAQPAPSVAGWAAGAESVDDRDGTPFAPGEDTVRLWRDGQQPVPDEHDVPTVRSRPAPAPQAPAQPHVPLAPEGLTFPAQDVQQPDGASQQPVQPQYQPQYQPQTPYQPQPYLRTPQPQPGQQVQPSAQQQPQPQQPQPHVAQQYLQTQPTDQHGQPVRPQPYPASQGQPFQQPVYIQPAVYVQPWAYGPAGIQPVAYGQPGYPQPGYPQPGYPQPGAFPQPPAGLQPPAGPQPAGQQAGLGGPPGMLAAAADRERAVDVLKAAFGEGRITKDEFDYRVNQVAQARTYADLGVVIADLPAGPLGGVSQYQGGLPATAPYYPPARQTTNGLAVGSLVCALLGISLPAVIMGHIARNQIRERNEGGDGLAIAGLVIGWLGIAFYALMFIAAIVAAGGGGQG